MPDAIPTYNDVMVLFRTMDAACVRFQEGTGTEEAYRAAFAEYQEAAMAYPGDLIMRRAEVYCPFSSTGECPSDCPNNQERACVNGEADDNQQTGDQA